VTAEGQQEIQGRENEEYFNIHRAARLETTFKHAGVPNNSSLNWLAINKH